MNENRAVFFDIFLITFTQACRPIDKLCTALSLICMLWKSPEYLFNLLTFQCLNVITGPLLITLFVFYS